MQILTGLFIYLSFHNKPLAIEEINVQDVKTRKGKVRRFCKYLYLYSYQLRTDNNTDSHCTVTLSYLSQKYTDFRVS